MSHLILSVDYEVFGNGTGDVRQHVVEPTERMADLCRRAGVPLVVFFEVEEYLAFEKYAKPLKADLGYDPAKLVRDQVTALSRQGHDFQLHLHPEWYGAVYDQIPESGVQRAWLLHPEKETVDSLFDTQEETTRYIAERKAVLEGLTGRRVQVYRAGAFSAQPGTKLLAALEANDIVIDSSVVKGLVRKRFCPSSSSNPPLRAGERARERCSDPNPPSVSDPPLRSGERAGVRCSDPNPSDLCLDYRNAPSAKGPWRVKDDVARTNAAGNVWEFPIYSVMGRRWQQLTLGRLRAKFSKNVPKGQQNRMIEQLGVRKHPLQFLKLLCQPVPIKLDFHNVSPGKLLQMIRSAPKPENGNPDVLVLIGHTKEHIDDRPFEKLLQRIAADPNLKVVSFSDVAEMVK